MGHHHIRIQVHHLHIHIHGIINLIIILVIMMIYHHYMKNIKIMDSIITPISSNENQIMTPGQDLLKILKQTQKDCIKRIVDIKGNVD